MKHVIFAMSLMALVSCKDSKNNESNTEMNTIEQPMEFHEGHQKDHDDHDNNTSNLYENDWEKQIETNEGAKWQADVKTNEGVQKMQNTIKMQTTSTLNDYHKLANQLNDNKNEVIKNCTMKGDSHDNLHTWLLPLVGKIEALSKSETIDDASKIKKSIEENVNAYSKYFE